MAEWLLRTAQVAAAGTAELRLPTGRRNTLRFLARPEGQHLFPDRQDSPARQVQGACFFSALLERCVGAQPSEQLALTRYLRRTVDGPPIFSKAMFTALPVTVLQRHINCLLMRKTNGHLTGSRKSFYENHYWEQDHVRELY